MARELKEKIEPTGSAGEVVDVVVVVDGHVHNGTRVTKGDKITVPTALQAWLVDNKIIQV